MFSYSVILVYNAMKMVFGVVRSRIAGYFGPKEMRVIA